MIERFTQGGIPWFEVDGPMMAALGAMPVILWREDQGGYIKQLGSPATAATMTADVADALRMTLADAWFQTRHYHKSYTGLVYQPIDFIVLDVPMPTSTNAMFVTAPNPKGPRERIKTRPYKAWIEAAMLVIKGQLRAQGAAAAPEHPIFGQHWGLWIRIRLDHTGDITNRIKAPEDLLVKWRVTVGDQWNDRTTIERDPSLEVDCRIVIYRKVQS